MYLVLWGKRKDQLSVKSDCDNIAHGKQQMTEIGEASKTDQSSQEFASAWCYQRGRQIDES